MSLLQLPRRCPKNVDELWRLIKDEEVKFYMFTNKAEFHDGHKIQDGLNVETTKGGKGFTFFDEDSCIDGFKECSFYREVKIPCDAKLSLEYAPVGCGYQYHTNKIIVGEKKRIYSDNEVFRKIIIEIPSLLMYIRDQTDELCRYAIEKNYKALK